MVAFTGHFRDVVWEESCNGGGLDEGVGFVHFWVNRVEGSGALGLVCLVMQRFESAAVVATRVELHGFL